MITKSKMERPGELTAFINYVQAGMCYVMVLQLVLLAEGANEDWMILGRYKCDSVQP